MLPHRVAPLLLLAVACAPAAAPSPPSPEGGTDVARGRSADAPAPIPVPAVTGPVAIRLVYPQPGSVIAARDSTFLIGSVGTGDASLTVNGIPVRVAPNGAFLAWLPLPGDSLMRFDLVARSPRDSQRVALDVARGTWQPADGRLRVEGASFMPRGRVWVARDEPVRFEVRATAGAVARLRLPDGTLVPLVEERVADDVPAGIRAFDRDPGNLQARARTGRYVTTLRGRAIGPAPGSLFANGGGAANGAPKPNGFPQLELVRGTDTLRTTWPLQLALLDTALHVVMLDDDPTRKGTTDSLTIGRAAPGGSYHWFLARGTRAVLERRQENEARVRLSAQGSAWVPMGDVVPLPPGTWPPVARVGAITVATLPEKAVIRIPMGERVPVRVRDEVRSLHLDLYSAVGDVDWIRYAPGDSLVERIEWSQASADEVRLDVHLDAPLWGWRLRWEGTDLVLDVRRPPVIDRDHPLEGRHILIDPGHPPLGATGPTGLREAEANLAVALELRRMLLEEGAAVEMTRTADEPLELWPRVDRADRSGAEILVSVHNNALPDGVNPYTNSGTSVFYGHAQSLPLARAVQRALVAELGERDLGVARGDLALVRPTWLPAILTEGLHMMVPEHEAALRSPEGQRRYARGIVEGLRAFLASRAR